MWLSSFNENSEKLLLDLELDFSVVEIEISVEFNLKFSLEILNFSFLKDIFSVKMFAKKLEELKIDIFSQLLSKISLNF